MIKIKIETKINKIFKPVFKFQFGRSQGTPDNLLNNIDYRENPTFCF